MQVTLAGEQTNTSTVARALEGSTRVAHAFLDARIAW